MDLPLVFGFLFDLSAKNLREGRKALSQAANTLDTIDIVYVYQKKETEVYYHGKACGILMDYQSVIEFEASRAFPAVFKVVTAQDQDYSRVIVFAFDRLSASTKFQLKKLFIED